MEKRVLLAVVLSFIVLYGYQAMFPPPVPQRATTGAPGQSGATGQPGATGQSGATSAAGAAAPATAATPDALPLEAAAPVATVVADSAERDIVVENAFVRATFTNRGAAIKSWKLKKYHDANGQPYELIPAIAPRGSAKPFMLSVDDAAMTPRLQHSLYRSSATELDAASGPVTLTFDYQDAGGLTVSKSFAFTPERPYVVAFTAKVSQGTTALVPTIHWGPALGDGLAEESTGVYSPPPQVIFYKDGSTTRASFDDTGAHANETGTFEFAGVDDHYFLAALAAGGQPLQMGYKPVLVPVEGREKPARFVDWSVKYQASPSNAPFFFGPKDFEVLFAVDPELTQAIHFGIFRPLVVPLLRALNWVNGYVGNYGWAIILLTALINIVMFPLRHKSVVSMRRMQDIQPEVKAIQERYSKLKMADPARQKMNVEMMNLYRERGVNPASGCVPMLLTLPVLFAFYSMLSVAIELRGAPFVGWIKDLSVYDPLFITPVLMGLTQFVQTKMTPSTADPMQQKMMLFMPLIFMTFFLWAPSGLVLYWTVSNLWAIGQQALTNKIIGPAPKPRPAAERQLKSAGGGKSDRAKDSKDSKDSNSKERK